MFRLFIFLISALIMLPSLAHGQKELSIMQITPAGTDSDVDRQIVLKFNREVVPLGKMERDSKDIPIKIKPEVSCQWRWIDTSTLGCQLTEEGKLLKSTSYEVTIDKSFKAADGVTLGKSTTHKFNTSNIKYSYSYFREWSSPGKPNITLNFSQPVSRDALLKNAHFVDSNGKKTAVSLQVDIYSRTNPRYVFDKSNNKFEDLGPQNYLSKEDDLKEYQEDVARRVWMISSKQELTGTTVQNLVIEGELTSALGPYKTIFKPTTIQSVTPYPEFSFLGYQCSAISSQDIMIPLQNTKKPECAPLQGVSMIFSSPVSKEQIQRLGFEPSLDNGQKDYKPWDEIHYSRDIPYRQDHSYPARMPQYLKVKTTYKIAGDLEDRFGRKLKSPINSSFTTDNRSPDFHITHTNAVMESQIENDHPIVLTNIDTINIDYQKITAKGSAKGTATISPKKASNIAFSYPLGISKILNGNSGLVFGKISTLPKVDKPNHATQFITQRTPWQVLVKYGHFNTTVWVTDLATGKPVEGASVSYFKTSYTLLYKAQKHFSSVKTNKDGLAVLPGSEKIDPDLKEFYAYNPDEKRIIVKIQKGNDVAFQPLDYEYKINTYKLMNSHSTQSKKWSHVKIWGTTSRGVYKAGESISYKLYVKAQNNNNFIAPPKGDYLLKILDPLGNVAFEKKSMQLSEFGTSHGEFKTSKNAPIGWYQFEVTPSFDKNTRYPARVLVTDFTPSPFRVSSTLNGQFFKKGDTVEISTLASLHSGGPYADAATRVTASFVAKDLELKNKLTKDFSFDTYSDSYNPNIEKTGQLDSKGEFETEIELDNLNIIYGTIFIESAAQDDRGKFISTVATADYHGVDRYVGLKNTAWTHEAGKTARVQYIVVDDKGETAKEQVEVTIEYYATTATRVKSSGKAYITRYSSKWEEVGSCEGSSKLDQGTSCDFIPKESGSYRYKAVVEDTNGTPHESQLYSWVVGKGGVLWEMPVGVGMELLPELNSYKVGDEAKFLVKTPYPGATALVTVERYGVIDSWLTTLEGNTPIIKVPVKENYIPGFYVSVSVVSKRAAEAKGFGRLDLGKPDFRIGYAKIDVLNTTKKLDIKIITNKEIYKPGEKVDLELSVNNESSKNLTKEFAIVVLDESVFDLIKGGKNYYNPYKGFYSLDSLDLTNFSLLKQLIGRQKFEKKGANQGGDGATAEAMAKEAPSTRSNFKYVAYWNPSIILRPNATHKFSFDLPDNLTGWRVLAMGVTSKDHMGLGEANFKTNQPTEVRPAIPNQVYEGDKFDAKFTVFNRTDKKRRLSVAVKIKGAAKSETIKQEVEVEPYKRHPVLVPVKANMLEGEEGNIEFQVKASDDSSSDSIVANLKVHSNKQIISAANYGTTIRNKTLQSLLIPKGIAKTGNKISVSLTPTVIANASGAFEYMKSYPYECWEQKLSKGVMASHFNSLQNYLDAKLWQNSKIVTKQVLDEAGAFQAPNGGMAYFVPQNDYVSPYLSAYTALAFSWLEKQGHKTPIPVREKLHKYLLSILKKTSTHPRLNNGTATTIRAVALAALAAYGKTNPSDLQRLITQNQKMSLFGRAMLLTAASQTKGAEKIAKSTASSILAEADQSAGKIQFVEGNKTDFQGIHGSITRSQCAILTSLTQWMAATPGSKNILKNVPFKMVRALTQTRGNRTHWENTQDNTFCMNALVDYSKVYEKAPPQMTVKVFINNKEFGKGSFKSFKNHPLKFSSPIKQSEAGKEKTVEINKEGKGRLYYTTRIDYATSDFDKKTTNAGIDISKEMYIKKGAKYELLHERDQIKRGDLIRVDIFTSVASPRHFVVIDDPIAGGFEPVNNDLATSSKVDGDSNEFSFGKNSPWFRHKNWTPYGSGRGSFYHKELRHAAARFYADYLEAGNYHLTYTMQAVATGEFVSPKIKAVEMYDSEVFGLGVDRMIEIEE